MKRILLLLLGLTLSMSLLNAAAFSKNAKARGTKVTITSQKPLSTGSNTFTLVIKKGSKALKASTKVMVKAFMPAMPGMPAMKSETSAKRLADGSYTTTVNLAMSGTWQFYIYLAPTEGKKSRVKTSFTF